MALVPAPNTCPAALPHPATVRMAMEFMQDCLLARFSCRATKAKHMSMATRDWGLGLLENLGARLRREMRSVACRQALAVDRFTSWGAQQASARAYSYNGNYTVIAGSYPVCACTAKPGVQNPASSLEFGTKVIHDGKLIMAVQTTSSMMPWKIRTSPCQSNTKGDYCLNVFGLIQSASPARWAVDPAEPSARLSLTYRQR